MKCELELEPERELDELEEDSSCQKSCVEDPVELLLLLLLRGEAEDSLLLTKPGGHCLEEPLEKALSEERPDEKVNNLGSCGTQSALEELEDPDEADELEDAEEDEDPLLQLPMTVEHGVGGKAKG